MTDDTMRRLAKVAEALDDFGLFDEADEVGDVMSKVAQVDSARVKGLQQELENWQRQIEQNAIMRGQAAAAMADEKASLPDDADPKANATQMGQIDERTAKDAERENYTHIQDGVAQTQVARIQGEIQKEMAKQMGAPVPANQVEA